MKIFGHPLSTCTRKVLATLAEKGKTAEMVVVDFAKGEHKQGDHMARQPFGRLPAFEDDGFRLYESRAIMRYVDEAGGSATLQGTDAKSRALVNQWVSVENCEFSAPAMKIVFETYFNPLFGKPTDQAVIDDNRPKVAACVAVMERQLAKTKFLAGDSFTIADITFLPYIEYLFAGKQGDLIESSPNVAAWWKRASERPSWQSAIGKA